jgi:outer membrane lipoprotein LolB
VPEPKPAPELSAAPRAFTVSGRIAIRQDQKSDIAKLRWTRQGGSDVWVVSSPLGNEVARIESGAGGATLVRAGEAPEHAASFQALTERLLGVALAPDEVAAWLHGERPRAGGGWKVTVDETQPAGRVTLARRLTAERGDVVVKLVIDEYSPLAD